MGVLGVGVGTPRTKVAVLDELVVCGRAPLRGAEGVVVGTTSSLALLGHWWLLPEGPSGAMVDGEDWCLVW